MCTDHGTVETSAPVAHRSLGRRGFLKGLAVTSLGVAGVGAMTLPAAAAETSQNGWPALRSPNLDTNFNGGGVTFPPGVLAGEVSVILGRVATRFNAEVEPLVNPGCWGHSYRAISGSSSFSNHASGTAIDCNAPAHPLGASGTFTAAQAATIHAIVDECEGTVRWGGDYSSRKDEMHFEINVGPGDPAIARVAAKFGGGTPPPPGSDKPTLREGSKGAAVSEAQGQLVKAGHNIAVDGDFGPKTKAAVVAFQNSKGLVADGIIGPKTWAALLA